jgi:hypothetical protein
MRSGNTKGQALAEFILVIPLFLVVLLGVVQFSLLYFAYQMVHYASFTATRAAIVRPCAAIHPDQAGDPNFTPAVFTAAVLATMVAAPPQELCGYSDAIDLHSFLPGLPNTVEVEGLDFDSRGSGPMEFALAKYANAACLTSVQRVENQGLIGRPIQWIATPQGPGPGIPCDGPVGHQQNVPAPGDDLTLEVTMIYPLTVPLINRVIFGVFVNFSAIAQDRLSLGQISGPGGPEDVMVTPTRTLVGFDRSSRFRDVLIPILNEFGYSTAVAASTIADGMADRAWYPVPIRARCTLTTEGAMYPLAGPPSRRGW